MLDNFTRAYLECALWSSNDESREDGGDPLDENYSIEDLSPEALAEARKDCDNFREQCAEDLEASGQSDERSGHDFWLTRNGHGAGFWDRGLGDIGDRLSDAAHVYGTVYLYIHDGKVCA